eukprot:11014630-Heterocapsa_arctica.AAC.1
MYFLASARVFARWLVPRCDLQLELPSSRLSATSTGTMSQTASWHVKHVFPMQVKHQSLPVVRASSHDGIDECKRSSPRPRGFTPRRSVRRCDEAHRCRRAGR